MSGHLLTYEQAAEFLGVSKRTMYRLVHEQRIDHIKSRGIVRFRREQLEAFLDECTVKAR